MASKFISLIAAVALSVLSAPAAKATTYTYSYKSTAYASLGDAEAAMRADIGAGGSALYYCGSSGTNPVIINYCTSIRAASHWFDEFGTSTVPSPACTGSNEVKTGFCTSESDLVSAYEAAWANAYPDKCQNGSGGDGSYAYPPITNWSVNSYISGGVLQYRYASHSHQNTVYAERKIGTIDWKYCANPMGPQNTASYFINWVEHFRCDPGYVPQTPTGYTFPYICKGPSASITRTGHEYASSCPSTGHPCVPATGEKILTETDFEWSGTAFARYYASLHDAPSGSTLDLRWSHTWNEHLTPPIGTSSTARARWRNERNDLDEFQFVSGSTTDMKSTNTNSRTLQKQADGTWVLQDASGWRRTFSVAGELVGIVHVDSLDAALSITYSGGAIATVTDARGRTLAFVQGGGKLQRIEDAAGAALFAYGYDGSGRLTSATYPGGKSRQYHYAEAAHLCVGSGTCSTSSFPNHLTGVTDERGVRILTVDYDTSGRAVSVISPGGANATALTYNATQPQTTVVEAGQGTALYTFENTPYRKPLSLAVSDGATPIGTETWEYPIDKLSRRHTNGNGVSDRDLFNAQGLQTSRIEAEKKGANTALPEKRSTETTWTTSGLPRPSVIQVKNAAGAAKARIERTYNGRAQLATQSLVDPATSAARTTTITYCEAADVTDPLANCPILGAVKSIQGPAGTTTFLYRTADHTGCATGPSTCAWRKGDLWKTVDAEGAVVELLAHDAAGRATSVLDANGVTTDIVYHARGWPTQLAVRGATGAGDAITTLTWTDDGQLASVTDPDGVTTTREYDSAGRLDAIEDAVGNRQELTLDAAGNAIQEDVKDASATVRRTLGRIFDTTGRLETVADAFSNPTDFTYDANGNLLTVTDANSVLTQNTYDNRDRLVSTMQDVGGISAQVQLQYDTLDRVTKVIDPKGLNTDYAYNGFGDVLQIDSPDSGTSTFTYDAAGNRATATDARGVVATYSYDDLGRVTGIDYSGGTAEDVSLTWDAAPSACATGETFAIGRLGTMTDGSGSTAYCYDRRGNLVRKIQTTGGVALQVRYGYTKADRLAWVEYPDGTLVAYARNANGEIASVDVTRPGSATEGLIASVSYHPFGPPSAIAYTAGRVQQRPLDAAGQPQSVTDSHADALTATFGFNAVGNLTSITEPSGSSPADITIDYDTLGRLTAFKDAPTGTPIEAYTYDATGNRTSFSHLGASQAYSYATNSHWLTAVGSDARTYDAAGNALTIGSASTYTYGAAGRMATASDSATSTSYAYTGAGEQVKSSAGSATTLFLYDEAGQLLGQYDGSGAPVQQYIWMDALPVGVIAGSQVLHVQPDHLGTPRAVIDPVRDVAVWEWPLLGEAFGATQPNEDPDGDSTQFVLDLRFPGQRYDVASGLNQNYYRDFDFRTGRYGTVDPMGLNAGTSVYGYAHGSPLSLKDPFGLWAWGDPLPDWMVDGAAAWGDTVSFGLTNQVRDLMGTNSVVNMCSKAYTTGQALGLANTVAIGWAGGARSAVKGWANYSHSLFPARWATGAAKYRKAWLDNGFGRWLAGRPSKNRLNGDFISWQLHARIDPFAYRMLSAAEKQMVGRPYGKIRQLVNRIPYFPGSLLYAGGSTAINEISNDCLCGD